MRKSLLRRFAAVAVCIVTPAMALAQLEPQAGIADLEFIQVSADGRHFIRRTSRDKFVPWGFNYDHDRNNRLLETYWRKEWRLVEEDFAEMKQLGANTVRIHLQVSAFMKSATKLNPESLAQLAQLVKLAEKTGLYLDVTGLGCYDKQEVPRWYNRLEESQRWNVQARFWEAVAMTCSNSPAIFCYDLMNEPVVSEDKKGRDWTPGAFGDRYFVQRLTLDFKGRSPRAIADAWVGQMVSAIRKHESRRLITVGAIPWAMTWTNARPLIEANTNLDFVSLHFYPKSGEVDRALNALAVYDLGKPIVIEEMFPLSCSTAELNQFIDGSRPLATGWIGFYWGKTIAEYQREKRTIADVGWSFLSGRARRFLTQARAKNVDDHRIHDRMDPRPGQGRFFTGSQSEFLRTAGVALVGRTAPAASITRSTASIVSNDGLKFPGR